ncbi:hypothetical protein C8F01DRAFT_1094751 [Mycena amicta]|nr:hypothetical protein C8F01DRAFT_1094751 [Mycena amicta]
MAIRSPPRPPSIAHRSSLSPPTMFVQAETSSPRHHLRISNEETSMSDGGDQEAAQILVSLRSATNVSTNLQSTPTPDPLTFLLDLPPSLTRQTALPLSPLSLAMLAYHDQEIPSTPPHFVRTETTRERTTQPSTIPRAPYPSPSFRPLLPRRDTPFPYFDPEQRVQTQRLQLGVLEARNEGVVAEITAPVQPTLEEEGEDEGKQFSNKSRRSRLTIMAEESPMDVDEALKPTEAPQVEEEHPLLQPTQPALVATTANTNSVNAAIAELGLPANRPPTVFQAPLLFQQQTRFNAATYTILRHYLPDDPHLQAMAEKIIEFQARAPEAERLALLRDVLAAFLKQIIRRVEEEQARAQEVLGDNVVHGWMMLLEALHWAHERLANNTSAALEQVLEIASEYAYLLGKVTEAIDEVHEREVAIYQNRLAASGRVSRNESAPTTERQSATFGPAFPVATNESPDIDRHSPVGSGEALQGWDILVEEAPLRSPEEEHELARELANMQFGPEELSREEMMPTILAPTPLHPPLTASRLESSVNPNDTVRSGSLASLDFPLDFVSRGTAHEGTTHNDNGSILNGELAGSPSQTVLNNLLDEFGQLHAAGEQDPAHRVLQRAFAYVLRHPFSPDDGDPDVFRDDAQVLVRTSSNDTEQSSIWGEPLPEAVESLAAVQRVEEEYRRAADEFLVPSYKQPATDNALGLVLHERAPDPVANTEPTSSAVVYAAWPQGSVSSTLDVVRAANTFRFGFGTATLAHHAVHENCPPTPVVHRQPAATFTVVTRGPGQWDRLPVAFADNNPCYPHFRPRPGQPYDPLLPLEIYEKKGAFLRAPKPGMIDAMVPSPNESTTDATSGRPSFLLFLSDLRLNHHPYALPDALGPRMEQELAMALRNPYALGLLLDHDSIDAPNGYQLAYLYDYNEKPIYVDPTKEDIELKQILFRKLIQYLRMTRFQQSTAGLHFDLALHARAMRTHALAFIQRAIPFFVSVGADFDHGMYQWYQDHHWSTRRRFYGTHPVLRPFKRALGEILWSQMAELGYHDQANDWASFLNARYVCDNVLEDLLEMGWLDIDAEVGDEGLWTQQLPNLVYDDHSSFTAASVPPDEERKQLFHEDDVQLNESETGSSSDDLSYFSQDDDDDDSIACETTLVEEAPNLHTTTFRALLREPFNLTHPNDLPPGTRFIIDTGAPVTVSTSAATMATISEPLHVYVANPSGFVYPPPSTNELKVPPNTPTGDTERDHIAESLDEYEDVTDSESLIEMDVREEDDGWYDYASDGGSWA